MVHKFFKILLLVTLIFLFIAPTKASAQTIERWSNSSTWGGTLPSSSTIVTIPNGKTVLYDAGTTNVSGIVIDHGGKLIFEDKAFSLSTKYIVVHGALEIGTESQPFVNKGTITFTGTDTTENVMNMNMGTKGILIHGGNVSLHGKLSNTDWTRINQHANKNATQMVLEKSVDWKAGDKIVIASTDYDAKQAEELTITGVNGNVVSFTPALKYDHYGQNQTYGGKTATTRAEVGLLTRNVLLQGDSSSTVEGFGGHIMAMQGSAVKISGIELYRMGQKLGNRGILGRYPLHMHMAGDQSGWYIKNSSIHHSFNRCITIHGTNYTTVSDNVCYDTIGHMYFFEDAVEHHNVLERNLGILARRPVDPLLISDAVNGFGPAVFWVSHPTNFLRGNVAAGSEGSGIWFDVQAKPLGLSANVPIVPRDQPLGEDTGNVSHSNGSFGWFTEFWTPPTDAVIKDFLTYKNLSDGMWIDGNGPWTNRGMLRVNNAMILDSRNGIIIAGWGHVNNSVIVGESANTGIAGNPADLLTGFKFYGGPAKVENTSFVNFVSSPSRRAGGIGWRDGFHQGRDVYNRTTGLAFQNANRVWFVPRPELQNNPQADVSFPSQSFIDEDGSVGGIPGAIISAPIPVVISHLSTLKPEWYGAVNPYHTAMMSYGDSRVVRDDGAFITVGPGDGRFNVMVGRAYALYRNNPSCNTEIVYRPEWKDDTIRVSIPYSCSLSQVQRIRDGSSFTPVNSLSELDSGNGQKYYYDQVNKFLYVKLISSGTSRYEGIPGEPREISESIRVFGSGTIAPPTSFPAPPAFDGPIPTVVPVAVSGDANGDTRVDGIDYIIWLNHYNQQVSGSQNGDFNNDNNVDGLDYIIWLNNYGS